ncbi:MAG: PLP-dependent aminotransferase family protein, partial [Lachnospiraceae bacterium]|nr:PLP-dependent aminotransferase family protein [Lachnospiraceae bacterium]
VKVLSFPVDKDGLIVKNLPEKGLIALHLSPTHHYPTGVTMSAARRHAAISWAHSTDTYIIEDDYDSEIGATAHPLASLKDLAPEKVIYMNTFSKSLFPSVRISYMVLPDLLMEKYKKELGFYSATVSVTEQSTLAAFIEGGFYERNIRRMRNFYKKYRQAFKEAFASSSLFKKAEIISPDSGTICIIKIKADINDEKYKNALINKGIHVSSVNDCCHHHEEKYDHCFIIDYSVPLNGLKDFFETMYESIATLP